MVRVLYRSIFGLSLIGCLAYPAQVNASPITFQGLGASSLVTIGGTNAANYHGQVNAGEYNWTWAGTPPAGFATSFYSYCVDLAHYVGQPSQDVTVQSSAGFTNGVANGGAKAAWLFNQYAAGVHAIADAVTRNVRAAALQIAIWEAMYDTSRNLGGGGFTVSASYAITSQANTYLSALYSSNYLTSVATILNSNGNQDQITAQVSEPSTLLLMGLAFFGFATLARRPVRTTAS